MDTSTQKLRVTIAGATGFVGRHLLAQAPKTWQLNALSRGLVQNSSGEKLQWRQADLFSLTSATKALLNTDVAIYLVHSMLPSTRLFQGNFTDADLLIADNFSRACVKNNVKQIIYLGGLVPTQNISKHLASRQEVEEVFEASGIPLTVFRSGMVAGQGGSSFEILRNLVMNLPGMILPKWTQAKTQVIYIDDLVRVILASALNPEFFNRTLDIVNGESLNYETLIRTTCRALGKKPILFRVPVRSTNFSKLWVSVFGKTHYELASPLIDSLLCELPQNPPDHLISSLIQYRSFSEMLAVILKTPSDPTESKKQKRKLLHPNTVRSIQRLPSLPEMSSEEIAKEYNTWLPKAMLRLITVTSARDPGVVTFKLKLFSKQLLVLKHVPRLANDLERAKFHIIGGLLSKQFDCGWLEFRQIARRKFTLVSINEFVPTLPWYVYRFTQAVFHQWVMNAFGEHLTKVKLRKRS